MLEMTQLLAQHGLTIVFANVLLAQAGVPLPAVPMLIVAGAFVAQGQLGLVPLVVVTVLGSLLGDIPWYVAGRRHGYRILRTLCRVAIEPDSCVKQTENIFERWGAPSLMVAKYIPGFSTVAPPLAGTMKLGFMTFLLFSTMAALLWAALPIAVGFALHTEVGHVLDWLEGLGTGALAVVAAVLTLYVAVKLVERYMLIRFLRTVRIGVHELHDMIARGEAPVILDARSASARRYDPRRIPGAIAVDMVAPERYLHHVLPERDVVVYCS
jgi:membrane protein DedA with SNARE-associated domain